MGSVEAIPTNIISPNPTLQNWFVRQKLSCHPLITPIRIQTTSLSKV